MSMHKKASFVQENIGKIILIIIGLTIITFFIAKIYLAYDANSAACQQSVKLRASLPALGKDLTPLRCKTEKYCFVGQSGGSCKSTWGDAKDIAYVKVKDKLGIEKFISDKMVSCYNMMDKGQSLLFSDALAEKYSLAFVYPTCIVCSRFAFDFASLVKIDLKTINPMEYMSNYKMPDSQISYLNYFTDNSGKINTEKTINFNELADRIKQAENQMQTEGLTEGEKRMLYDQSIYTDMEKYERDLREAANPSLDTLTGFEELESQKELAIVFMQITAPTTWDVISTDLKTAGFGLGTSTYVFGAGNTAKGISWVAFKNQLGFGAILRSMWNNLKQGSAPISAAKLKEYFKVGPLGKVVAGAIVVAMAGQAILTQKNRAIAANYFGEFGEGESVRSGCSATKLIYYNEQGIKSMCSIIESY